MRPPSASLYALAFCAAALLPAAAASKAEPVPDKNAPVVSPAKEGDKILREMSAKLVAAQTFGFTATREIDPALIEGQQIAEKARVTVVVQRPGKFAAQAMSAAGMRRFVFDGQTLTLSDARSNHYATVPAPKTIDGLVERLDAKYGFVPPLLEFAMSNPYAEFRQQARSVTYLGRGRTLGGVFGLGGVECHRIELKGREADAELWIGVADSLPHKLVATFHREGNPQLHVDFLKWNLAPSLTSTEFTFTPPPGAEKIEMWTKARMQAQAAAKH